MNENYANYVFPITADKALKIGCGRFRQEEHLLENCRDEIERFGTHPLLLGDDNTLPLVQKTLEKTLSGMHLKTLCYRGFCCKETALEYVRNGVLQGIDVIVAAGGGIILDFAKLLSDIGKLPLITVPTSSATCCAYTPLAICYTQAGRHVGSVWLRREIDCCLLDMGILSHQPPLYLLAGALDAMAKKIEIDFWKEIPGNNGHAAARAYGSVISEYLYRELDKILEGAYDDIRQGKMTQRIFNMVYHSIVGGGLSSGICGSARQCAIAHRLYYYVRTFYDAKDSPYTHGTIVAVGMIAQFAYNGSEKEAEMFAGRLRRLSMPASMKELGVRHGGEALKECVDYMMTQEEMVLAGKDKQVRLEHALSYIFH